MKKKEEGYEEELPDGAPKKKPEEEQNSPESRLDALENEVKSISKSVSEILKFVKKEEESDSDEGEDEKDNQGEPDKEKKKEEGIGTKPVNPNPEGGEAKLPKAPAGETDETDKPVGDKGPAVVEKKDIEKMVDDKVQQILKGMGIQKSTTPRGKHEELLKQNSAKKAEFALDLLKRAKEGKLSVADMNRETKDFVKGSYDEQLQKVLDMEVE